MPLTPAEQAELDQLEKEVGTPQGEAYHNKWAPWQKTAPDQNDPYGLGGLSEEAAKGVSNSFNPVGSANPVSWLAQKLGITKIPGALMNRAVGRSDLPAHVGQTLVDEGLVGTKSGLQNQIATGLENRGAQLSKAVDTIDRPIDSTQIAQGVSKLGNRYRTPGGAVPAEVAPEMGKVWSVAEDIQKRGMTSPQEALAFKRIAGSVGYDASKPLSSLSAELGQAESGQYGRALENAYSQSNPVGAPNAVSEANKSLSALLKAKQGLSRPDTGNGVVGLLGDAGAVGGGAMIGHPGLGLSAMIGRHAAKSPLVQSAAAQGTNIAGKGISRALNSSAAKSAAIRGSEEVGQGLTPDEDAEMKQLEKELAGAR